MLNGVLRGFVVSVCFLLPCVAFGEVKLLKSGDSITMEFFTGQQTGSGPVAFGDAKSSSAYTIQIDENGDRKYLRPNGSVHSVTDKNFTPTMFRDKPIDKDRRIVRFPPEGNLKPGIQWEVPPFNASTSCGDAVVRYRATSDIAPDVRITIDDKPTTVKAIRIAYDGIVSGCNSSWKRTLELLYSPDLNQLISSVEINWDRAGDGKTFMYGGDKWAITAIRSTADGK